MLDAKKNKGQLLPYLRNPNVRWFNVDTTDLRMMPFETREFERYGLRSGDIVVCEGGEAGRAAIWDGLLPNVKFQKAVHRVRTGPRLYNRYLVHRLMADYYSGSLADYYTGTTIKHFTGQDLARYEFPLPPIREQKRIVAILDQASSLREKRKAIVARFDILVEAILFKMFGDLARNERGWPTANVTEICELVRGSSPRPQGDPKFFGGPVPRLMVADITRDGWLVTPRIDSLTIEGAKRSRPVSAGTVVMAVSGNVGVVSRLAIDACVHDGFVAFTNLNESRCEPSFLLALLHFSKALHERSKAGAIFINLTTTDIKAMKLPIPPISLQREFARRLAAVEKLKAVQNSSTTKMDELFVSLQHRAFRGEL